MMKKMLVILAALAGLWGAPLFADDIVLKDLQGNDRRLSEFIGKGQWTVVAAWHSQCPICKAELPQMTFFHAERRRKDAIVLGISVDGYGRKAAVEQFIEDQALNFTNLIGTPALMTKMSGRAFHGTPTFYIFTPQGKLAAVNVGPLSLEALESFIATGNAKLARGESIEFR